MQINPKYADAPRPEQYAIYRNLADECYGASDQEYEDAIRAEIPGYCSQLSVRRCSECSLCNYGRDCHGAKIAQIRIPRKPSPSDPAKEAAFAVFFRD